MTEEHDIRELGPWMASRSRTTSLRKKETSRFCSTAVLGLCYSSLACTLQNTVTMFLQMLQVFEPHKDVQLRNNDLGNQEHSSHILC